MGAAVPLDGGDGDDVAVGLVAPAVEEALEVDGRAVELGHGRGLGLLGLGELAAGQLLQAHEARAQEWEIAAELERLPRSLGLQLLLACRVLTIQ